MALTRESLGDFLRPFVELSYPVKGVENGVPTTLYGKGRLDFRYALFWAVAFSVLRHVGMKYILSPLARRVIPTPPLDHKPTSPAMERHLKRVAAKKKEHNSVRFAEQAWAMAYCTVFWTIGMVILHRIPNATSPEQLWGTYPYTPLPALTKFYYLAQLGWWFHQLYVINTEKPRKDHWQMFGHHLLSIALIGSSYLANYTRIGVVVHSLMDFCDILLPLAKLLRYMAFSRACDAAFVVFLVSWIVTRQVGLFLVIKSAAIEAPKYIAFKWDPEHGHYLTKGMYYSFIILLSILLVLCTVWFYMAIMVAVRVVRGQGAEDTRSDSEDTDDDAISLEDEDDVISNGANGHTNGVNGHANGHANGNGATNGITNGITNGNGVNGHSSAVNGHANGLKNRKH